MNTEDINFAYRVRHALNEKLDDLPAATTDRLAKARQMALARKKADAPLAVRVVKTELASAGSGNLGSFMAQFSWLNRAGVIFSLLLLVAGMYSVYHHAQQQRIEELAELDAAVLSDELPLTAYLDHGFNAYLNQREQ